MVSDAMVIAPSKGDLVTSEVSGYLELLQKEGSKDLLGKAMDALNDWIPNSKEEVELELNAELWCRLGRLALAHNQPKVALFTAESALKNGDPRVLKKDYAQIPITRLRWYAVAQALYGESLHRLLDG